MAATIISFDCANETLGVMVADVMPLRLGGLDKYFQPLLLECAFVCAAAAPPLDRARALGEYLTALDARLMRAAVAPTDVILEDQTINRLSGAVMQQLLYHYRALRVHIISPRAKNAICFRADLAHAEIRARLDAAKGRRVSNKLVNKTHSRENMKAWFGVWRRGPAFEIWGIPPRQEEHVADAFMQAYAGRVQFGIAVQL